VGKVAPTAEERARAYASALYLVKALVQEGQGYIHPNARVGSLGDYEWRKIVSAIVSGWIIDRMAVLVDARCEGNPNICITGEVPEPSELGLVKAILPHLGDLIAGLGLNDKPIGEWGWEQVALFVWTAAGLLEEVRTRVDERPDEVPFDPGTLVAG
jgi:hypothetical protein